MKKIFISTLKSKANAFKFTTKDRVSVLMGMAYMAAMDVNYAMASDPFANITKGMNLVKTFFTGYKTRLNC